MAGSPSIANTTTNPPTLKGELITFLCKMKSENYSDDTIERYERALVTLAKRGADLLNIESIKTTIANQQCSNGTKQSSRSAATLFLQYHGIQPNLPKYQQIRKMAFIPLENELDQLISGNKHQMATFLQTLKETAARFGEALDLKWTDLNTETNAISITPEKGSNPRSIKVSNKLMIMLNTLPRDKTKIFGYTSKKSARNNFVRARSRIAKNLCNPRIKQIHFHTFRHWKATMELHRTNNVYAVMKMLGHKSLSNTQIYIGLLPDLSDDFVCEVATTPQEIIKLITNDFEKVTEMNGQQFFRKRK